MDWHSARFRLLMETWEPNPLAASMLAFALEGLSQWPVLVEIEIGQVVESEIGQVIEIEIGQVFHHDSMVCLLEFLTLVYQEAMVFGCRLFSVVQGSNSWHGPGFQRIVGTVLE